MKSNILNNNNFDSLPLKCILLLKFAFSDDEIKQLSSIISFDTNRNYTFSRIGNFLVFEDLNLLEDISQLLNKNNFIKLIPAYIKINNMFFTFNNFNKFNSEYTKNDLESGLVTQLAFTTNPHLAIDNILTTTSKYL